MAARSASPIITARRIVVGAPASAVKSAAFVGVVAQLGERRVRNAKVGSSILLHSTNMSADGLRALVLEDEPTDAELALMALAEGGFRCQPTLASGRAAFEAAFAPGRFDLVLADYSLPDYTGLEALAFVRRTDALVPFMLVSGALGEERAVEALRAGATDYILKHGLARLAPAVRRALDERRERGRHLATSCPLQLSQERRRALSRRLLELQEEERPSLAPDLHHDLVPALPAPQ